MSSESYLARWNAYLNSFNNSEVVDNADSSKPQLGDESEIDNVIAESTELDGKKMDAR